MKKIISVIVAVIMLSAMICTAAFAEVEYVSPGSIIVPYTSGDNITIDGTLAQGEWSETNKLQLNETNLVNWTTPFVGPIDFYYSWGDKGLYIAAVVSDELMGTTGSQIDPDGSAGGGTRFQLAFNPGGIIADDYMGLFFSFLPTKNLEGAEHEFVVDCWRHNWEDSDNGAVQVEEGEEGYIGRYSYVYEGDKIVGWNMEAILPWVFLASPDREWGLDDDYEYEELNLTKFNPKDEDRSRAFITATVAYVQEPGTATGRTTTDGIVTWEVDSYDVILFLAREGELERETVTGSFKTNPPAPQTDAPATDAPDTKAPETNAPDTKAPETKAPETKAPENTPKDTKPVDKPAENKGGFPVWLIIVIAVVVVAAVVVGIVLAGKKKKA
ncbi:MAG: hypothetical protein II777_06730 [Clostridia bacterium]|nr:hypothetical protein [Clostridia bacterium]